MTTFKSALTMARAIRKREVSPVEVLRATLERVDAIDPALNAIVWRRDEEALADARRAEEQVMRGEPLPPFHGVPLPIKDLTEVQGEPHASGSRATAGRVGRFDAPSVGKMREAGFVFFGRSAAPEFGTLPVTESAAFGATRNPWDLSRTPGGSSGGAAAAVAAGIVPLAHASDGGGSIRIPASCTGLVGLKPSRGRIPRGPIVSDVLHGFSQEGALTTDVADTAAFLDAVAHLRPSSWHNAPPPAAPFAELARREAPRLKIGFTTEGPVPSAPTQAIVDAVTRTATMLADRGHEVTPARPAVWGEAPEQVGEDFITMWASGMVYLDPLDWSRVEPHNRELFELSKERTSFDYVKALMRLQVFASRTVASWGQDFDLLLLPTLAMEPVPIGWLATLGAKSATELLWRCTDFVPYCGWANVTGQPAISLPVAVSPSGLPIGVQLVAAPWREDLLLQVARELEEMVGWRDQLPVAVATPQASR